MVRNRGRLLARREEQLLAIQVQVLIGHEVVHCFVEVLVGPARSHDHAVLELHLAHAGDIVVLLRQVVRVDFLGEADVVAHCRLRVLLLLVRVELGLLHFGGLGALLGLAQRRWLHHIAVVG